MANLTAKQEEVIGAIMNGHNLVVCGQAGTGKSYVLKHAIRKLRSCGKNVAVTATTGVASQQFGMQDAMTVHR
jgi:type II secretory pathway predicted ATPase ExeA